jgi:uncharacterized membrane protein (DUF485 family)
MFARFMFVCTILSALLGILVVLVSFASGMSAPQQAAAAGVACAMGILPYVIARSSAAINQRSADQNTERIVQALQNNAPPHIDR